MEPAVLLMNLTTTDILFAAGVVSTITCILIDKQSLFLDVFHLFGLMLIISIPLIQLAFTIFPNYTLELRIAAILTLFFLYVISIGLGLVFLSHMFDRGLFSEIPALALLVATALIIYLFTRNKDLNPLPDEPFSTRLYKILLIGVSYITVTVIISWHFDFNRPLGQATLLYTLVLLLALLGSSQDLRNLEKAAILFIIPTVLIFQNELALPILGAGDSDKEYYISNIVLAQENWLVGTNQSKFSVLTTVILNPILSLLSPISLEGVYRFIYPPLFSMIAPILYFVYQSDFSRQVSYWGSLVLVFLHPFYTVFSLNTRTGYILLFMSLLLLFYFYSQTESLSQRLLQLGLLFLLSTTYYAAGPMFIIVLAVAKTTQILDAYLRNTPTDPLSRIPSSDIALFGVCMVGWLIYTTESYTFDLVVGVLIGTILKASTDLFGISSSAGGSAFTQDFSYTYQLINNIYIFLTILVLFSLVLLTYLRYLSSDNRRYSGSYYPVFVGGGLIFVAAFLPTSSVGIARLYTIGLIFLAPASVFGIYYISNHFSPNISKFIPILMIFILVINTGLFGMAIGDDRITQQHIIEDDSGDLQDYYASQWAIDFKGSGEQIYGSGDSDRLLGEFFVTKYQSGVPGDYSLLRSEDQNGLIYLSSRSVEDRTVTSRMYYRGGLATEREYISYDEYDLNETNLVYTTGKSQVRYRV